MDTPSATTLRPTFDGRDATPGAYARIENALYDAATALAATGEKIAIIACGNASLPLGVLFGAVYSPFVFDLAWKQAAPGAPEETWSLMCGVAHVGTTVRHTKENLNSEDLVLAVSINADVERVCGGVPCCGGFRATSNDFGWTGEWPRSNVDGRFLLNRDSRSSTTRLMPRAISRASFG